MQSFANKNVLAVAASLAVGLGTVIGFAAAPASAAPARPCAQFRNVAHVVTRTGDAIEQLQHDSHDYGGHRVRAIAALENARREAIAAKDYAIANENANPKCFAPGHALEGGAFENNHTGARSDGFLARDIRFVRNLAVQLERDGDDYGGHRVAAIDALHAADRELVTAEQFDRTH